MLNLKPIHRIEDLNKNDLIFVIPAGHRNGRNAILRVGGIDGKFLFLEKPNDKMRIRFPGGDDFYKVTLEEMLTYNQVLRICNEESDS